jgi:hypothetical protein
MVKKPSHGTILLSHFKQENKWPLAILGMPLSNKNFLHISNCSSAFPWVTHPLNLGYDTFSLTVTVYCVIPFLCADGHKS